MFRTMTLPPLLILTMFAIPMLFVTASAQCPDPPVPPGGFAIQEFLGNPMAPYAWSDGYQVLIDIRFPTAAPGPCGWPLIVFVHGGGGNRGVVAPEAQAFASLGYITCAYDVRGQGPSSTLNPPALQHDITGLRELLDLFEAMEAVEALYSMETDLGRIGVNGYSQGGGHSWWAAQHSGRMPPLNGWRNMPFPTVSAVVIKDSGGGLGGSSLTAFSDHQVERLFGLGGTVYEPAGAAQLQAAILAEDFAGYAALTSAPGMDPAVLIPQITVPVYAHLSYDDKWVNPSGVFASWDLISAGTPKRLQLGTSGHDSPQNENDRRHYSENRKAWFDRFLKGQMNGITNGPTIVAQVTPEDVPTYQDPQSLWDFRTQDTLPALATVNQTFYLGPGGGLLGAPPAATGFSPINHMVPGWLNIAAYTAWFPTAGQLAGAIPPSSVIYDSPPATQDRHLQGEVTVNLAVNTMDPDYQLHAVLFDVSPMGGTRWMTSGAISIRGTAGQNVLNLSTYLQSYVLRQGHSLRLQIENLVIHRPPTGLAPEIEFIPCFSSSVVNILEGAPQLSFIDVPFLPFPGPRLVTNLCYQSVTGLQDQRLTIHSDSSFAGALYLVLPPATGGTSPGTVIGGVTVPQNTIDFALALALLINPSLPPFVNFSGTLGTTGSANAGLQIAGVILPAAAAGLEVSMAGLISTGALSATNPVTVSLVP